MEGVGALPLVLITGLSGSGKSQVAHCFEDLGYFVIDNLPLPLLRPLLRDPAALVPGIPRLAVVADMRVPELPAELPRLLAAIDRERVQPVVLYLESSDQALVRRYSETRRRHPLAPTRPVIEGIRAERERLADLRGLADLVLDTSEWSPHELRAEILREFGAAGSIEAGLRLTLVSFGFKFGVPHGSDLVFDVRYLPNPHFVAGLRERDGRDPEIRRYLEQHTDYAELLDRLTGLFTYLLPKYQRENRSYLTIAIGCTGGRHRSVAVCEAIGAALRDAGFGPHLVHRDLER